MAAVKIGDDWFNPRFITSVSKVKQLPTGGWGFEVEFSTGKPTVTMEYDKEHLAHVGQGKFVSAID